jgi:hypothetical protein
MGERRQHSALEDLEIKKKVQVYYKRLYDETVGHATRPARRRRAPTPPATSASTLRSNT